MAGLIQEKMGAAPEEMQQPGAMQETAEQEAPEGMEADEDSEINEDDPAFQQALTYAYEALYRNEAAKDVAKQLKAAPDVSKGMSDVAYQIVQVVDERTDGNVPDDMLGLLAMSILQEVGEIAEAAGLNPSPDDVAKSFKDMILRYMQDQGADVSQLSQAMDQVDPAVFREGTQTGAMQPA